MSEANGQANGDLAPDGTEMAVRDRRRNPWCWIPRYIPERYAEELGSSAVALYVALAYHAGTEGSCYPSLCRLSKESGLNRGTVKRILPALVGAGLLQIERRKHACGRDFTNLYTLLDPESTPDLSEEPGIVGAGGASCQGGARSAPGRGAQRAPGGARSAPPIPELDPIGTRSNGREAHTLPTPSPDEASAHRVCALWMALLVPRKKIIRAEHEAEIASEVADLLRLGWTEEQLCTSIQLPERARTEWPREWRARLTARGLKPPQTQPDPAEAAQRARETASRAERDRQGVLDFLGGAAPSEVLRNRRKKAPQAEQ